MTETTTPPLPISTPIFHPTSAIVSRVTRFLAYPDKIFPISCTCVSVEDSYFQETDQNGKEKYHFYETITGSRTYLTKCIKGNAGVLVDLSKLRSKGATGSNGIVSEGVTNFMGIYSAINEEVRRGSAFKNGAVTLSLDWSHPDLIDFINFPSNKTPWAKRAVTVTKEILLPENSKELNAVIEGLRAGTIFVNKQSYNDRGQKLFPNVCTSIRLKSRSTCTLLPVNLGMVENIEDLPDAIINGANDVIKIWDLFYQAKLKQGEHFLDPTEDKQVGLGLLGLANMLARFDISYDSFTYCLCKAVGMSDSYFKEKGIKTTRKAERLVDKFFEGYHKAGKIARRNNFERFFAIEPTASVSFNSVDLDGYTCTPEISPPVCHPITKTVRRQTEHGFTEYTYPPKVEVASKDVSYETYYLLCQAFQSLQGYWDTSLAHGTNFNWWLEMPLDKESFTDWYQSSLISIYYRWQTAYDIQDKTTIGLTVDPDSSNFWGDADISVISEYLSSDSALGCSVKTQLDGGICTSCG